MASPKVWLITGSSTGFGLYMARVVLSHGNKVIATLRKPSALDSLASEYPSSQLLILPLDVSKPDQIEAAFAKGKEVFDRIDVVYNNAGVLAIGEVEGTPEQAARDMFEVNFWGASNVNRTAMKYFPLNQPIGGLLLLVSSEAALLAVPGLGYYSASKYAIEGVTEALKAEIDPNWNIKITIIEPGPFATNVQGNAVMLPVHPAYISESLATVALRANPGLIVFDGDAEKASEAFWKISNLEDPPERFLIHRKTAQSARQKVQKLTQALDEALVEGIYI
ncbi:NAD-P-binding protein [Crucibulum laeve]|uniref:NAD-P-binding protein n=1 Tax=Crucibulum laeve TaxID=68775 RepID=A0A5C3LNT0_9AGAR|nr:NAD-P-binding protein [Crucibulum laeve]